MSAVSNKINEIKVKISKIQNNYAMKLNFVNKNGIELTTSDSEWHVDKTFGEGLRFKAIPQEKYNKESNIFLFHSKKGHIVEKHTHDDNQIIICVEGCLRIIINNNEHIILNPWESVFIEKDLIHLTEALNETIFISIWK